MANTTTWNGSANFTVGSTPFGFYDTDTDFQTDANKVAKFCGTRLGYPLMEVELQDENFFACFEEAVSTYGNEVFQYKIRENYISLEGSNSTNSINNKLINPSLDRLIQIGKNYGTEADVGGNVTRYTGTLNISSSIQEYNLDQWAVEQGITGSIEIRRVFYEAPPAIQRYFDPYAGTGTGIQSLMDAFDFGSYSPGVNFLMMPASFDMLKTQAIEFNDQIRRSAYTFQLINNTLTVLPLPKAAGKMRFEYFKVNEKKAASIQDGAGLITNVAEVPYNNPSYLSINSIGRQWIFRYTLALSKELLAYVRGKYQNVPVPGSEVTLNQADLLADARSEKLELLTSLREMLEQTSRQSQLERRASESENLNRTLKEIPMTIYIG
jgi:hypothetical protein